MCERSIKALCFNDIKSIEATYTKRSQGVLLFLEDSPLFGEKVISRRIPC